MENICVREDFFKAGGSVKNTYAAYKLRLGI